MSKNFRKVCWRYSELTEPTHHLQNERGQLSGFSTPRALINLLRAPACRPGAVVRHASMSFPIQYGLDISIIVTTYSNDVLSKLRIRNHQNLWFDWWGMSPGPLSVHVCTAGLHFPAMPRLEGAVCFDVVSSRKKRQSNYQIAIRIMEGFWQNPTTSKSPME